MKSRKFPAAAIKALLHLAQQPQAHLLIVAECCYLLDGKSKTPKHIHIPSAALSALREMGWITTPEERGQQLAECAIAQAGKAAAASILELQSTYHQLEFDTDILQAHIKAQAAPDQESQAEAVQTEPEPAATTSEAEELETSSTESEYAEQEAATPQAEENESPEVHPLMQKSVYWQGPAYYGDELYTIRVMGHCPNMRPASVYIDLWNEKTPLFSTYAKYTSIHLLDQPAPTPEATTIEQPAPAKKRRKTKEEAKAASNEKRATIQKNMQQAVSNLLESIKAGKSEHLLQYLAFSAKFHKYSPLNQLLIAMQAPEATHVAGYTTWKNAGYQVRKGEKGIAILAPRPYGKVTKKNEEADKEETIGYQGITFSTAYVFDVSQLEENPDKPLPTFFTPLADDQEGLYARIAQAVRAEGIKLEIGDTGSAQGWSAGSHIRLKSGLDSTNRCLTLIHEFAHEKLHHNEAGRAMSSNKKECHAEAISFIVSHHFGINNPYSSDYLQSWSNTEKELLAELETIKTTASAIIEAIEAQEEEAPTPIQTAPAYPACFYCQQPAAENAQTLNGLAICAACIAEEIAAAPLDEMPDPTEPEPPTLIGDPAQTEAEPAAPIDSQETEAEPKATPTQTEPPAPADGPTPTEAEQNRNTTKASKHQAEKTEKQGAHSISLRWHSDAYTVSSEGYAKIKALIKEYATCHRCEQYYTAERLNVAGNICLDCFMKEHGRNQGLTYVGPGEPSGDGTARYLFLDGRGMIHITFQGPSASESGQESETETLKYWSFPVPTHFNKDGETIAINGAYWNIHGDPRRSVCIVHVWDSYPDKIEAYYLVSNTGKLTQINKRKASHRALFTQAKKRLETMKTNNKEWYIHGMIAQMLDEDASLWPVA